MKMAGLLIMDKRNDITMPCGWFFCCCNMEIFNFARSSHFFFFLLPYLFYGFNNDAVQISNVQLGNPKWLLPIFPTTMPFRTDFQLK